MRVPCVGWCYFCDASDALYASRAAVLCALTVVMLRLVACLMVRFVLLGLTLMLNVLAVRAIVIPAKVMMISIGLDGCGTHLV